MMRLLLLVSALIVVACSGSTDPDPALASVFAIMCADADPEEPPHPCCTGFALGGQVVTANHCVPGDDAVLVSRDQWLHTANAWEPGHVVARDESRDIAWLDAAVDAQLTRGAPIASGARIAALTISGVKPGTAYSQAGYFWLTDADTLLGDSGSAVVDAHGDVIGVLSRCTTQDGKQCDRASGIFAELP